MIGRLAECDFVCLGCGSICCRDINPSPGEVDLLCAACWDEEAPDDAA